MKNISAHSEREIGKHKKSNQERNNSTFSTEL